jgi:hypothetical protein
LQEENSDAHKVFRRHFRVPYAIYQQLYVMAMELGFKSNPVDVTGRQGISLSLQILGVLRVLGRSTCYDGIEELSKGSAESHRVFFHSFFAKFVEKHFEEYVHPPESDEEIATVMNIYERLGPPSAIGSVDCVHCRWDMTPAGLYNQCKGKEGYPTSAWEAVVDHHMKFRSVTNCFLGASNDQTIMKYDQYLNDVRDEEDDFRSRSLSSSPSPSATVLFAVAGGVESAEVTAVAALSKPS